VPARYKARGLLKGEPKMTKSTEATPAQITGIATKIVNLLSPLGSQDRQKVIQGSLMLLGESGGSTAGSVGRLDDGHGGNMTEAKSVHNLAGVSPKANAWLKHNGITSDEIENVFDIANGEVTVIAAKIEGKSTKERTLNTYVVLGIGKLLATGDASFDDKSARELCDTQGCYNSPNHAVYLAAKGNLFTGSKDKGWKLTAPGLKRGAELLKAIA
jgi:hypothetical protein